MRIQHNIPAMNGYRNYSANISKVNKSLEKLSSGSRINRAGDDAAGLAISEKMRAQISGLEQAQSNAKSGINLVQTAEGALTEVHDMLNRMYTLAEQSANGTYSDDVDREQLQKEVNSLRTEINRIADSANFNGIKLLDGSLDGTLQTKDVKNVDVKVVADGQLGKEQQAGKYSIDLSNTLVKAKDDGGTVTLTVFGLDMEVELAKKGDELSEEKLAQAFADKWNASNTAEWEDDYGFKMTASVEGNKLVLSMDQAPSAEWKVGLENDSGTFVYSDVTGNNAEEVTITVDQEAVDATQGRMYGQATFTLGAATGVKLRDGETVTIGDQTYVFAIGTGSKFADAENVVDLTDKTEKSTDLAKVAADRLSKAAVGNSMFKVGTTDKSGQIMITEKEGAVDYAVNNLAGKDGVGTKGKDGTADAKATDWAGLVKTGKGIASSLSKSLTLQIGDTSEKFNQMAVSVEDMHAAAMGIGSIDISSQAGAADAVAKIKDAVNYVSNTRGTLGALQNRLDHTINNLGVMQENIQDAESTIRDVDVAKEMMSYTKNSILVQSAQAMLAQANQLPQGVLQLLG